jgi:hypothetical protein
MKSFLLEGINNSIRSVFMGNKLIFVQTDDWEVLYVNGKLNSENHRMQAGDWLELLIDFKCFATVETFWVDEDYMHDLGNFPDRFSDLPKEVLS